MGCQTLTPASQAAGLSQVLFDDGDLLTFSLADAAAVRDKKAVSGASAWRESLHMKTGFSFAAAARAAEGPRAPPSPACGACRPQPPPRARARAGARRCAFPPCFSRTAF